MERPCLNNPDEFPGDEVLSRCLGKVKATWDSFVALLGEKDPAIFAEWRYYRDGELALQGHEKEKDDLLGLGLVRSVQGAVLLRRQGRRPDRRE